MDEILKLRVVRAARGGRSFGGAIKKKSRQFVRRAIEYKIKSVEDQFEIERTFREQMIMKGWRSEAIGGIDRETKEYLEPGRRSYHEREKFEG